MLFGTVNQISDAILLSVARITFPEDLDVLKDRSSGYDGQFDGALQNWQTMINSFPQFAFDGPGDPRVRILLTEASHPEPSSLSSTC